MTTVAKLSEILEWIAEGNWTKEQLQRAVRFEQRRAERLRAIKLIGVATVTVCVAEVAACLLFLAFAHYSRVGDILGAMVFVPMILIGCYIGSAVFAVGCMDDEPRGGWR